MKAYLDIVYKIMTEGVRKANRTGIDSLTIPSASFEHDMAEGFPFLTTKKMFFNRAASELEFFIKGITDKKWLQDRKNRFWNEWASPDKVPYGHDDETKRRMMEERDLGPIYGFQWRHFGAEYKGYDADYTGKGFDQFVEYIINKLRDDPHDRRMIVSAWNPWDIPKMALPPCHWAFHVTVVNDKLNLKWMQRSVDTMLGLPYNIAEYGLLLELLAKDSGFKPGILSGSLDDTHIYVNHVDGANEQLKRVTFPLPRLNLNYEYDSVLDWDYRQASLGDYRHHDAIKFEVAV